MGQSLQTLLLLWPKYCFFQDLCLTSLKSVNRLESTRDPQWLWRWPHEEIRLADGQTLLWLHQQWVEPTWQGTSIVLQRWYTWYIYVYSFWEICGTRIRSMWQCQIFLALRIEDGYLSRPFIWQSHWNVMRLPNNRPTRFFTSFIMHFWCKM